MELVGMCSFCLQNSPKFLKNQNKLTNPAQSLQHPQQSSVGDRVKIIVRAKFSYLIFFWQPHP